MSTHTRSKVFWTKSLLTLLGTLALPLLCLGQQSKLVIGPADPLTIKRGSAATGNVKVVVLPGFHVNSDKPKDEFLIPLKLTWTSGPLQAKSITYPKPEEIKVGSQDLLVFTGTFSIQTNFEAPQNVAAGSATMAGKLRYQACNNEMCFRPATIDVRVPVTID